MIASYKGHVATVDMLIRRGADVNIADNVRWYYNVLMRYNIRMGLLR